jgi:hypothetical protein
METFEDLLSVPEQDIEFEFMGFPQIAWSDYWLNPRRLRGSDFLMRWSQGVWSEDRLIEAINDTSEFFATEYGLSSVAPDNDIKAFESYFERLDKAGLANIKRPDLLVFSKDKQEKIERIIADIGGKKELPFNRETDLAELISYALIGIECENSLWKCKIMPDYGTPLTPQRRLQGLLGLKKTAVVPTIIVKDEDLEPLAAWQHSNHKDIHIWHVFYDMAFGIPFNRAKQLMDSGQIEPTKYTYQAPGGATTTKTIYKIYYHHAYKLAESVKEPSLEGAFIQDKNGHILPYVTFKDGKLELLDEAIKTLRKLQG